MTFPKSLTQPFGRMDFSHNNKKIVVIETPPTMTPFRQVTTMMDEEELKQARKERPDLLFKLAEELPSEGEFEEVEDKHGVSVRGMITPGSMLS